MAFKQRVKSLLKEGSMAKIIVGGMEYEGKVVEFENLNPPDAHVTLEQADGTQYILPVSTAMVVVIPPVQDELEPEDEPEDDEPQRVKANPKSQTKKK
jgi:hypothetical protein